MIGVPSLFANRTLQSAVNLMHHHVSLFSAYLALLPVIVVPALLTVGPAQADGISDQSLPASAPASPVITAASPLRQGSQISLNGRTYAVPWSQWQNPAGEIATGLSDMALRRHLGVELLNTRNPQQQPIRWFANTSLTLPTHFSPGGGLRYLDVTSLAQQSRWQIQPQGNLLQIVTPPATVKMVRLGRQPWGIRLVMDLDQPAPWRLTKLTNSRNGDTVREVIMTVDAAIAPALTGVVQVPSGSPWKSLKITAGQGQTTLQGTFAGNVLPEVSFLANPDRLLVDLRPDPTTPREIVWAPGLTWREQVLTLDGIRFPVTWLEVNPRQPGVQLQPIWGPTDRLVGIQTLSGLAQQAQAAAAINAGFFNRDKQTPLGALRQQGNWISSPILNRGAIAWNSQGQFRVGRVALQEVVSSNAGPATPLVSLNSGYPQKGIARYTRAWGASYTPLLQTETIITVDNQRVVRQQPSNSAANFAIPAQGYLLVLRDIKPGPALAVGANLQVQNQTNPGDFNSYSEIVGAGPLLVENGRVVLNAQAEQFRPPFDSQGADRSGIGQRADGTVILAAVHNRVGGVGPTLNQWARLMQQLGTVNALNLDGGSSTSLYLGGELLDRHPTTAARVHNGIGVLLRTP